MRSCLKLSDPVRKVKSSSGREFHLVNDILDGSEEQCDEIFHRLRLAAKPNAHISRQRGTKYYTDWYLFIEEVCLRIGVDRTEDIVLNILLSDS